MNKDVPYERLKQIAEMLEAQLPALPGTNGKPAKPCLNPAGGLWREEVGVSGAALVLTANSNHMLVPAKALPKSTEAVNRPLETGTARFVTGPASAVPVRLVANSVN